MIQLGSIVRVLPPFKDTYPDTYEVTELLPEVYILGELGGFDIKYLELVE